MANELRTANDVRRFLYAGDAVLTLESRKTGKHFTYRVMRKGGDVGSATAAWFVKILVDGDKWIYMGMLYPPDRGRLHGLRRTKASQFSDELPSWRAFDFLLKSLQSRSGNDEMPPSLTVRHEGRCGRCRRALTTPASIDLGIGPICAAEMGLTDGC